MDFVCKEQPLLSLPTYIDPLLPKTIASEDRIFLSVNIDSSGCEFCKLFIISSQVDLWLKYPPICAIVFICSSNKACSHFSNISWVHGIDCMS